MQESASLWKEREVIFSQFWEAAGSRPARSRHFELCHLGWRRIPERFGRQKVTDRITPAMPTVGYLSDSDGREAAVDGQLHPIHEARIV